MLGNQKEICVDNVAGAACVELLASPNPFFFYGWEASGTFPSFPNPPVRSSPGPVFGSGEQTRLLSVILHLIGEDVHGASLKPYELI